MDVHRCCDVRNAFQMLRLINAVHLVVDTMPIMVLVCQGVPNHQTIVGPRREIIDARDDRIDHLDRIVVPPLLWLNLAPPLLPITVGMEPKGCPVI
jgi:hypothetical protein